MKLLFNLPLRYYVKQYIQNLPVKHPFRSKAQ
jgi:hypothetical protein